MTTQQKLRQLKSKKLGTLAIKNTIEQRGKDYLYEERQDEESLGGIINGAFTWSETPQGKEFWRSVSEDNTRRLSEKTYKDYVHLDTSLSQR